MKVYLGSTVENIGIFSEQVYIYEKENLSTYDFAFSSVFVSIYIYIIYI